MLPKGKLIIIGGAEDKGQHPAISELNAEYEEMEILKHLLPSNKVDARIEVITTASNIGDEIREMYREAFSKIDYKNVGFMDIQDKSESRESEFLERIEKCHTILFSGGDQFKIATIIGGTPMADAICRKYMEDPDFIVAGTSAGAMAMSQIMIYSGGVNEALFDSDLKVTSGLGLLANCIVDTHFVKRGRFGRLAHAVTVNPSHLGIGLGEDTALIIRKGYDAECFGSGMVIVIDGRFIEHTNIPVAKEAIPIYVQNLKVHLLVKGCRFDLRERSLKLKETK